MPRPSRRQRLLALCSLVLIPALLGTSARLRRPPQPLYIEDLDPGSLASGFVCGTETAEAIARGFEDAAPLADGTPVYFDQDPPILTPAYDGKVTLRNFTVVGNHKKVVFEPNIPGVDTTETWKRVSTRKIQGNTVSVFEPSWPKEEVDRILQGQIHGWDSIGVVWSDVQHPGKGRRPRRAGETSTVTVRIGSTTIPDVAVNKIDNNAYYTSHIANLVIEDYGDSRIVDESVDAEAVAKQFFKYFKDIYDNLAIVPQSVHIANFCAFHVRSRNQIRGIGGDIFDNSGDFGSNGKLTGYDFYPNSAFAENEGYVHETAHQWGHFFDWDLLANLTRAGHQPSAHTPLLHPHETLIGSVLSGDREVMESAGVASLGRTNRANGFEIALPESAYLYHPLTLYAMGIIPSGQIPSLTVFEDQAQFDPNTNTSPTLGTSVTGDTVEVDGDDIVAVHGKRTGPKVKGKFRKATVVVSRDGPLSQEEFNFWTFFAARQAHSTKKKKVRDGVVSWSDYGSFFQATGDRVKLDGRIVPKKGARQTRSSEAKLNVTFPGFGRDDWRGVLFDEVIPGKIKPRTTLNLSGNVTATDRSDFDSVLLTWKRHPNADKSDEIANFFGVDGNGRFNVSVTFGKKHEGRWRLEVFLFFPNSSGQFPRMGRRLITVASR